MKIRKVKKIKAPKLVPVKETESIPAPDWFIKKQPATAPAEVPAIGREVEIGKAVTPT